jgi:hypothetical protein
MGCNHSAERECLFTRQRKTSQAESVSGIGGIQSRRSELLKKAER